MKRVLTITAIALLAVAGLTSCSKSSDKASSTPSASATERPTKVDGCKDITSKAHDPATLPQPTKPDAVLKTSMTLTTNCGDIVIEFNKAAPQTVTNISYLAANKYFDGTYCHRLTTEGLYVLQCGDPTASGSGGPTGWKGYGEENLPKAGDNNYPAGTVAMANAGKGTNGSQFFLVYKDSTLPADYTIFGKITKGLDFIQKLQAVGAYTINQSDNQAYYTNDGMPIQPVEILKVSVN